MVVGEVAGIQNLKAGVVLPIERRVVRRAARLPGVSRRVKPETEMVHLDRVEGRIQAGIRHHSTGEHYWRRRRTLCERERLHVESTDKLLMAAAVFVGDDVTLIPGDPKRRFRNLKDKEIEVRVSG